MFDASLVFRGDFRQGISSLLCRFYSFSGSPGCSCVSLSILSMARGADCGLTALALFPLSPLQALSSPAHKSTRSPRRFFRVYRVIFVMLLVFIPLTL